MSSPHLPTAREDAQLIHFQVVPAATALAPDVSHLVWRPPVRVRVFAAHVNVTAPIDATSDTNGRFEFLKGTAINNLTPTPEVQQVETATAVGTIGTGTARITVTAAGMTNSPKPVNFTVVAADNASAIAGKARTALAADVDVDAFFTVSGSGADIILTAKTKAANDATMNMASADVTSNGITEATTSANTTAGVAPVLQVETATAAGNISTSGDLTVIVTAAGMTGTPKTVNVAVLDTDDTGSAIAAKIRAALTADANVGHVTTGFFTVSGATDQIILTSKVAAANDGTMNIAIADGTCVGATAAPTSANTTAGVLGTLQVETATITGTITGAGNAEVIVTAAGMPNSPITLAVAVADADTAALWAAKVRTALAANDDIASMFIVGGSSDAISLTRIDRAANDATLNISLANGTAFGITAAPTSANTTAGVAPTAGALPGERMSILPGKYGSADVNQGIDGFTVEANQALFLRVVDIGNNGTPTGLGVTLTVGYA